MRTGPNGALYCVREFLSTVWCLSAPFVARKYCFFLTVAFGIRSRFGFGNQNRYRSRLVVCVSSVSELNRRGLYDAQLVEDFFSDGLRLIAMCVLTFDKGHKNTFSV